jgi:ABC-type thiamine transport system ATPase subunit
LSDLRLVDLVFEHARKTYRLVPSPFAIEKGQVGRVVAASRDVADEFGNVILGLATRPRGAEIKLDGREVVACPPGERDIGLVPAGGGLFPHMSVRDNLAAGRRPHPQDDAVDGVVEVMAGRLNLDGFLSRRPHELSPDDRLKVALARAMCHDRTVQAILIEDRSGHPLSHSVVSAAVRAFPDLAVLVVTDRGDQLEGLGPYPRAEVVFDADRS